MSLLLPFPINTAPVVDPGGSDGNVLTVDVPGLGVVGDDLQTVAENAAALFNAPCGYNYSATNAAVDPATDVEGSRGSIYWIINPDASFVLPPMAEMTANKRWRVLVSTDWAARAAASPPPTWVTDGSDEIVGKFPATGTEWVSLVASPSGDLNSDNPGTPCWLIVSTAGDNSIPDGIGSLTIGNNFTIQ